MTLSRRSTLAGALAALVAGGLVIGAASLGSANVVAAPESTGTIGAAGHVPTTTSASVAASAYPSFAPAATVVSAGPSTFATPAPAEPATSAASTPTFAPDVTAFATSRVPAAGGTGSTSTAQALDDLGSAGARLAALGPYQFRISLGGSLAKGGPVRGERLVVTGTVIPGIGRLVRFDASGRGAEPSVTYLERGSDAWLLLPTGRWLSVVPVDGDQPGTFTQYFPSAFYRTYDWPWIAGATLRPRQTASASNPAGTLSARSAAMATRSYVVDPGTLVERASGAGFTAPVHWKMVVTVAPASGALMAVEFSGQTTEARGRINAFTESLVITPIRRATLPKPG